MYYSTQFLESSSYMKLRSNIIQYHKSECCPMCNAENEDLCVCRECHQAYHKNCTSTCPLCLFNHKEYNFVLSAQKTAFFKLFLNKKYLNYIDEGSLDVDSFNKIKTGKVQSLTFPNIYPVLNWFYYIDNFHLAINDYNILMNLDMNSLLIPFKKESSFFSGFKLHGLLKIMPNVFSCFIIGEEGICYLVQYTLV